MKKIMFMILMLFGTIAYSQTDIVYCVQVLSTENPHLIKKEDVNFLPDTAMVEPVRINGKNMYRVLFVYNDELDRDVAHSSWLKVFTKALRCTRTKEEYQKMFPLFGTK